MACALGRNVGAGLPHRPAAAAVRGRHRARLRAHGRPLSRTLRSRVGWFRPTRLELVSLHIPKTGGTSFRAALSAEYGDDLFSAYEDFKINAREWRAVHGHIGADTFWSASRRAKLITWLRDPADRIQSYYEFWLNAEPEGNPNHVAFKNSGMTLLEFAEWEPIRTEFEDKYIQDLSPNRFDFIGFTDNYERDLARLRHILEWQIAPASVQQNVTPGDRPVLDDATRLEIERLHHFEVDFYRRARDQQR